MTLVIAGYMFENSPESSRSKWAGVWPQAPQGSELALNTKSDKRGEPATELKPVGVFVAADSTITSGTQTLLSGFRKIYPVTVKVWRPYFIGEYFKAYREENSSHAILVAFAGSTLTAQHFLNSITGHLERLRITYRQAAGPIAYRVMTDCDDSNPLFQPGKSYGEDTFTPADMEAFKPTAQDIADAMLHSLRHALKSASQYKIDQTGFDTLKTPFVAAMQCPARRDYHIYKFDMLQKDGVYPVEMEVSMQRVPFDRVAVLGMGGKFDEKALATYTAAIQDSRSTAESSFAFLNSTIDFVKDHGRAEIDRPSVLRVLQDDEVSSKVVRDQPQTEIFSDD